MTSNSTAPPRILLLGVGNLLYKDEGIGVHTVQYLEKTYDFSDNVTVMEGGTLGKILMGPIMDCDKLIVIDAVLGGHEPGTLYRLEGEGLRQSLGFHDSQHQVDLVDILIHCDMAGHRPEAVIIGMEPLDWKTLSMELTPICLAALPRFIENILQELKAQGGVSQKKQ